jgi:hypothetical protein
MKHVVGEEEGRAKAVSGEQEEEPVRTLGCS